MTECQTMNVERLRSGSTDFETIVFERRSVRGYTNQTVPREVPAPVRPAAGLLRLDHSAGIAFHGGLRPTFGPHPPAGAGEAGGGDDH